jgi:hypothetical protein
MSISSPADSRTLTAEGVLARVERSVVPVRGSVTRAAGWVALANGLVLTTQESVRYEQRVEIEVVGKRQSARVIWVDVAHDLAAVLPSEVVNVPPLRVRTDLPRPGENVFVIGRLPDEPARIVPAMITSIDRRFGSIRCFEVSGAPAMSGAVVVDGEGRLLGVSGLDIPRGTMRGLHPRPEEHIAMPAAPLMKLLASLDLPRGGAIETRAASYACPSCATLFTPDLMRCLACGADLPHAWALSAPVASATRLVRELFDGLGVHAANVRTGPRSFRLLTPSADANPGMTQPLSRRGSEITIEVSVAGDVVRGLFPLVRIPTANHEALFRFLLTLNDQLAPGFQIALRDGVAVLAFVEPTDGLRPVDAAADVRELLRLGEHYRRALSEPFGAEPVFAI